MSDFEARQEIRILEARIARAEKVIQAARQLVEETRYLTVEQCERDGLPAGTGNRLRDALAEYGEEDEPSGRLGRSVIDGLTAQDIINALMEPSEELVKAVRDALDKEDQRKACTFDDYARAAMRALAMKMLGEPTATPELT